MADPKKETVKEEKPKQVTWRVAVAAVMACADSDNKLHGLSIGAVASVKYRDDAHNCLQNRVKT